MDQPGLISRDHSTPVLEASAARPFSIISLVGGKWTTFRGFAEEAADMAFKRLGRTRRLSTETAPIGGGRDYPLSGEDKAVWIARVAGQSALPARRVETLLARYGSTAEALALHLSKFDGDRPLAGCPDYSTGEIDWLARFAMVVRLDDIVMRRTTMAIENKVTAATLEDVAAVMGDAHGWDDARRQSETQALGQRLATFHGMRIRS